jgi:hypothetical protein
MEADLQDIQAMQTTPANTNWDALILGDDNEVRKLHNP